WAGGLARRLSAAGVDVEVPVAIYLPRSLEHVVAALGVLMAGGVYVPLDADAPAERLSFLLADTGAPLVVTTAALAEELPPAFAPLRNLVFGGEAADPWRLREVLAAGAPPARLLNGYGPTESATFASWREVREVPPGALSVPIGRAVANTGLYVMDPYLQPQPVGVPGELYIGGDGL